MAVGESAVQDTEVVRWVLHASQAGTISWTHVDGNTYRSLRNGARLELRRTENDVVQLLFSAEGCTTIECLAQRPGQPRPGTDEYRLNAIMTKTWLYVCGRFAPPTMSPSERFLYGPAPRRTKT
jgi:hypothetical protein